MARTNDSLAILGGLVPLIPVGVRRVGILSVEEFHALDAEGDYVERRETDELVCLHYRYGGAMYLKSAKAAVFCRLAGTPQIKPKN